VLSSSLLPLHGSSITVDKAAALTVLSLVSHNQSNFLTARLKNVIIQAWISCRRLARGPRKSYYWTMTIPLSERVKATVSVNRQGVGSTIQFYNLLHSLGPCSAPAIHVSHTSVATSY